MKNNSILKLIPFVLLLCIPLMGPLQTDGLEALLPIEKTVTLGYTTHAPIVITHNDNFTEQGFLGSGTEGEPYYLEDVEILSDSVCLNVTNTTAYFEVRSSILHSETATWEDRKGYGAYFDNVSHFAIIGCEFSEKETSMRILCSSNGSIINNQFFENNGAVSVYGTDDLEISNNFVNCTTLEDVHYTDSGFYMTESSRILFHENTVVHATVSAYFFHVNELNITSNTDIVSSDGLKVSSCSNVSILDNTFTDEIDFGIKISYSEEGTILRNNSLYGTSLEMLEDWNYTLEDNTVNELPIVLHYNISNQVLQSDGWGQLIVAESENISVIDSDFTGGGVTFGACANVSVSNSRFSGVSGSFISIVSETVGFSNNTLHNSKGNAILLDESNNVTINDNLITRCTRYSIYIDKGENVTIDTNRIFSSNWYGIRSSYADALTVTNNYICGSTHSGLYLRDADNCTLSNNTITGNGEYGLQLDRCHNGTLTMNYLGWNPDGDAYDTESDNIWSGNHYSDYSGSGAYDIAKFEGSVNSDTEPSLLTDDSLPVTDVLEDVNFELGAIPNPESLSWDISEEFPLEYQLLKNGTAIQSDSLYMTTINAGLAGLVPALYNFTLVLTECTGNSTIETVMVKVHPSEGPVIELTILTESPTPEDDVIIQASVTDNSEIAEVVLSYSLNNSGTWTNITMTGSSGYEAIIPNQANGTTVQLKAFAEDALGNSAVSETLVYTVRLLATEPTTPIPPLDEGMIMLVGVGGAVVVLGMIVVLVKKR